MKHSISSFLLTATLLAMAAGCTVEAHGRVVAPQPVAVVEVEEEPPPPRTVVVETRPGFVFIEGRWFRRGGRWEWQDGRWERERVGHVWVAGRWERRGNKHVWIEGSWRAGGGATVRDHREPPPSPAPPPEPVVRDHRH
jgi:hypothetical protein